MDGQRQADRSSDRCSDQRNFCRECEQAEDRELFDEILEECEIHVRQEERCLLQEEAKRSCKQTWISGSGKTLPYVLGGQGMQSRSMIMISDEFIGIINPDADHPILVDKYLQERNRGRCSCDGEHSGPGIIDTLERKECSGDSISVYPAQRA